MLEMVPSIKSAIRSVCDDTKSVDLFKVAHILSSTFPEYSLTELSRRVAEVAVMDGCRYLVWEPPEDWGH